MNSWDSDDIDYWNKLDVEDKLKCIRYVKIVNKHFPTSSERQELNKLNLYFSEKNIEVCYTPKDILKEIRSEDIPF